jgi:hypothetical protein
MKNGWPSSRRQTVQDCFGIERTALVVRFQTALPRHGTLTHERYSTRDA